MKKTNHLYQTVALPKSLIRNLRSEAKKNEVSMQKFTCMILRAVISDGDMLHDALSRAIAKQFGVNTTEEEE